MSGSLVGTLPGDLVGPPGRGGGSLLEGFFVGNPVLLGVVEGVNHFRNQLVGFCNLEHGPRVLVTPAVVSG